jgi:hypothetical protein
MILLSAALTRRESEDALEGAEDAFAEFAEFKTGAT